MVSTAASSSTLVVPSWITSTTTQAPFNHILIPLKHGDEEDHDSPDDKGSPSSKFRLSGHSNRQRSLLPQSVSPRRIMPFIAPLHRVQLSTPLQCSITNVLATFLSLFVQYKTCPFRAITRQDPQWLQQRLFIGDAMLSCYVSSAGARLPHALVADYVSPGTCTVVSPMCLHLQDDTWLISYHVVSHSVDPKPGSHCKQSASWPHASAANSHILAVPVTNCNSSFAERSPQFYSVSDQALLSFSRFFFRSIFLIGGDRSGQFECRTWTSVTKAATIPTGYLLFVPWRPKG